MDLIDEQHVPVVEVGEDRGEVTRSLDGRTARGVDADPQLARDDVGERGLAQAGRPVQQDVVRRLSPLAGGAQQDGEVVLDLRLADVLREAVGPQAGLHRHLVGERSVWRQRARLIHGCAV